VFRSVSPRSGRVSFVVVAAVTAVLGTALAACGSSGSGGAASSPAPSSPAASPAQSGADRAGVPAKPRTTAEGRTTAPPWATPADPAARVAVAGLPMLGAEGQVMHIHAHLDVLVNGKPVIVPALVGIDESAGRISPLHTHDTSGVIHIESPVKATFTLGQFMTEWDVALTGRRIGGLAAGGGRTLRAYVNGRQTKGDPAALVLHAHDEIALVYGPSGAKPKVPSRYNWPAGL
jgi:hypothetical protein